MKDSIEQDQRITREFGKYRLAPPSSDLQDCVLRAAREALSDSGAELNWTGRWLRACGTFRQEILAVVSSLMLILGVVMQLGGGQSALADSLERLTVMASVSGSLQRATSMDCTVLIPGAADEDSEYRVRWNTAGITRIDMIPADGMKQALWLSNGNVSLADDESGTVRSMAITAIPSKLRTLMGILTPTVLAQRIEEYGLMQTKGQDGAGQDEFLLLGQEDQQIIEMTVDAGTYLPKMLKKYIRDSARSKERICLEEVRFQWNKPIPRELLVPGSSAVQRQMN